MEPLIIASFMFI